jgi:hypothetical protein
MNRKLFTTIVASVLFGVSVLTLDLNATASAQQAKPATSAQQQSAGSPQGAQHSGPAPHSRSPESALGSSFTYHGRLTSAGSPANGSYDLRFTLYDASSGGVVSGGPLTNLGQAVSDGLFTVSLDFGQSAFQGSARWLEIAVRPSGGGSYTVLSPRQPLTASPYAVSLMPGSILTGTLSSSPVLSVTNTSAAQFATALSGNAPAAGSIGVKGTGGFDGLQGVGGQHGVYGTSSSTTGVGVAGAAGGALGYGVSGTGGAYGVVGSGTTAGVSGVSYEPDGYGVSGTVQNGTYSAGVYGLSNASNGTGVRGQADSGSSAIGVSGSSSSGYGVVGSSASYVGVYGLGTYGVYGAGLTNGTQSIGVYGESFDYNGRGLMGQANVGPSATGVYGSSSNGFGVRGTGSKGVYGTGTYGLFGVGNGTEAAGVYGEGTGSSYGVHGHTSSGYAAMWGDSTGAGGVGVLGDATGGTGSIGVWGRGAVGVYGLGSATGVSAHGYYYGVYAVADFGYAGYFQGDVRITGTCCSSPELRTQMDDPADPANKYLNRSAVQSQEMLETLSGNVTTDAQGNATVTVPASFQATNRDLRYQLTVIGEFAQAIVSSELKDNRFSVRTDKPNVKVSWQLTGVRDDPYARAHPLAAEQDKPSKEKGSYLNPELYGQPAAKRVGYDQEQMQRKDVRPNPAPGGR